ncbi:MAG: hypothetical protein J3K34DRAFT_465788 [Monoraphidium minutum]|nr:MAG: hypothetical protein J3K34DRAFT_465788 [Monoraphidium minutum]
MPCAGATAVLMLPDAKPPAAPSVCLDAGIMCPSDALLGAAAPAPRRARPRAPPPRAAAASPPPGGDARPPPGGWAAAAAEQQQQQRSLVLVNGVSAAAPPASPVSTFSSYSSYEDAPAEIGYDAEVCLEAEARRLQLLLGQLAACGGIDERIALLEAHPSLRPLRERPDLDGLWPALAALPPAQRFALLALPAAGQRHVLSLPPPGGGGPAAWAPHLRRLAGALERVEAFYDSMGGILGYQLKSLQLIAANSAEAAAAAANNAAGSAACGAAAAAARPGGADALAAFEGAPPPEAHSAPRAGGAAEVRYHVPPALDLAGEGGRRVGVRAAAAGIQALPFLAEILPVGGAGDRLGLKDEATGESLPAAMLPYTGRPMLEVLLRDLQAREYLYWQLTGRQLTTPVAVMTSDAKGNHGRITALLERAGWFGRDPSSFRLFRQPLVPVISSEDGRWLMTGPCKVMMKPGGHGAIWKLMHDEGSALVRQISNPMAGVDTTLLALAGTGYTQRRAFGFMSCERVVGAAEGMNVLQERRVWAADGKGDGSWSYDYAITNVEYTEFERLGIRDVAVDEASNHSVFPANTNILYASNHSVFPANTNILYVGLDAARRKVEAAVAAGGGDVLPGLIFNMKKKVKYFDPLLGAERAVYAGRMECTMQNLADSLTTPAPGPITLPADAPGGGDGLADALGRHAGGGGGGGDAAAAAEALAQRLDTFLVYNMRRKVTSSAKKRRTPGSTRIHQTPDGSFYDLMRNGWQVLQRCGMRYVPEVGSVSRYLEAGPGFIFLFHPALGPLWDVIAQKIRGGALMDGSELVLEVAEARLVDVTVDGSLLVAADAVMGHLQAEGAPPTSGHAAAPGLALPLDPAAAAAPGGGAPGGGGAAAAAGERLVFSSGCGRVHMMNVTVQNVGVDWHHPGNCYWRHQVQRHEACRVILHGRSEFEAYDCRISGDQVFEVPDGYRMVVTAAPPGGGLTRTLLPLAGGAPSWEWRYGMDEGGDVRVEFARNAALELLGYDHAALSAAGDEDARGTGVPRLTLGLMALDRLEIEVLLRSGTPLERRRASKLLPLVSQPHWLLCTLLMCNAACMETLPIFLDRLLNPVAAILLSVTAILFFGEIIPQAVCSRYGVAIGASVAPAVRGLMWVCAPVSWTLGWVLHKVLGSKDPLFARQQLQTILSLHGQDAGMGGTLTADEVAVMSGALELTMKTAAVAMTPMSKVFMLSEDAVLDDGLVDEILATGYSRIPVYRSGDRCHVFGLVLVKDLLQLLRLWRERGAPPRVSEVRVRPIPALPAMVPLYDVLKFFKTGHSHLALLLAPAGLSEAEVMAMGRTASAVPSKRASRASGGAPLGAASGGGGGEAQAQASGGGGGVAGDEILTIAEIGGTLPPGAPSLPSPFHLTQVDGAMGGGGGRGAGGWLGGVWRRLRRSGTGGGAAGVASGGGANGGPPPAEGGTRLAGAATLPANASAGSVWGGGNAAGGVMRRRTLSISEEGGDFGRSALAARSAIGGGSVGSSMSGGGLQHHPQEGLLAQSTLAPHIPCGIVTLEDVIEELMGSEIELMGSEIVDETDRYLDNDKQLPVDSGQLVSDLPPNLRMLLRHQVLDAASAAMLLLRQRSTALRTLTSPRATAVEIAPGSGRATASGGLEVEVPRDGAPPAAAGAVSALSAAAALAPPPSRHPSRLAGQPG